MAIVEGIDGRGPHFYSNVGPKAGSRHSHRYYFDPRSELSRHHAYEQALRQLRAIQYFKRGANAK